MHRKHLMLMLVCCLLPIAGFAVAFWLGVPLGTLGIVALLLICPLGHIIMMRGMGRHGHDHGGHPETVETSREKTS